MRISRYKIHSILQFLATQPPWYRYGLATLAVAAAAIVTLYIPVFGERAAFLLFFFAIIQTAFWLGRSPALFAMTLSLIAVNALILFPAWISQTLDFVILNTGFCILSTAIIVTTRSLSDTGDRPIDAGHESMRSALVLKSRLYQTLDSRF